MNFSQLLWNDCCHTANNDGVCIGWSLHIEYSCKVETVRGMLHQLNGSKRRGFRKM